MDKVASTHYRLSFYLGYYDSTQMPAFELESSSAFAPIQAGEFVSAANFSTLRVQDQHQLWEVAKVIHTLAVLADQNLHNVAVVLKRVPSSALEVH